LQKYFKEHDLEKAVEFQNILSLHITLYYLDKEIDAANKEQLVADIASLAESKDFTLSGLKVRYFGEPGKERVCYIGCADNSTLTETNAFFAEKYSLNQIPENQLSFVPHISLFRISDPDSFTPHRTAVDEIINRNIQSIDTSSLVTGPHLFQVSSLFRPEVQIALD
jgi:2'-5' RNA ligase